MIKKTIYIIIIASLLLISSCGKNANQATSPITVKEAESEYTVKGLDSKYNATWQFFNADSTGNNGVDVVIKDGEISGLVVSNKKTKVTFTKDDIYSIKDENKNKYYDRYYGYIKFF